MFTRQTLYNVCFVEEVQPSAGSYVFLLVSWVVYLSELDQVCRAGFWSFGPKNRNILNERNKNKNQRLHCFFR